jgi:hypothetical protein
MTEIERRDNLNITGPGVLRDKIQYLEAKMKQLPQIDIPVRHFFADGLYLRQIVIPAGTLITGVVHRFESMDVVMKGEISVINEHGYVGRIIAPCTLFSPPGIKKAGIAISETIWISIHANPTNERNIRVLEETLYESTPEDLARWERSRNREDYRQLLEDFGLTEEIVRAQSENMDDRECLLMEEFGLKVADSTIDGLGLFASREFCAGDVIAPAIIKGKRTEAYLFTNHSTTPNATMIFQDGLIDLVATKKISIDEEITVNYRDILKSTGGNICLH